MSESNDTDTDLYLHALNHMGVFEKSRAPSSTRTMEVRMEVKHISSGLRNSNARRRERTGGCRDNAVAELLIWHA